MLKITNASYKIAPDKTILHDINLTISNNEFISIIGSNGAGKSTMLKLITSFIQPSSGRIERNYHDHDVRYVLQDYKASTFENLTVKENMLIAAYKHKSSFLKRPSIDFKYWLEKLNLGLEYKIDELMSSLSGGQRQAVSIIMAIMMHPKLLVLDEHTSALDPVTAKNLMDISYKLCKGNNITTVMVTHDLSHAAQYSDRILVVKEGKITHDLKSNQNISELMTFIMSDE